MLLHGLCSGPGRMRMSCHSAPLRQLRCPPLASFPNPPCGLEVDGRQEAWPRHLHHKAKDNFHPSSLQDSGEIGAVRTALRAVDGNDPRSVGDVRSPPVWSARKNNNNFTLHLHAKIRTMLLEHRHGCSYEYKSYRPLINLVPDFPE